MTAKIPMTRRPTASVVSARRERVRLMPRNYPSRGRCRVDGFERDLLECGVEEQATLLGRKAGLEHGDLVIAVIPPEFDLLHGFGEFLQQSVSGSRAGRSTLGIC